MWEKSLINYDQLIEGSHVIIKKQDMNNHLIKKKEKWKQTLD